MCLLVTVTWPHAGSSGECHTTHCHHHHQPYLVYPRVHAVRWIMYRHSALQLPCFYLWLFILFLNVLNWSFCSLYVHYSIQTFVVFTSNFNHKYSLHCPICSQVRTQCSMRSSCCSAAVLQSAVRSSGGGGVETSFPKQNINISTFPLQLKTIILCTESLTPSTLQGEMEFWILWILNSWICKTIVTKLGSTFRVK